MEKKKRRLNLPSVGRPVLKLILLLQWKMGLMKGKQGPVFLLSPKDYSFYE